MQKNIVIALFILLANSLMAQVGGNSTYKFLELTNSARMAALGGNVISIKEKASKYSDISAAYHNPALLDSVMTHQVALNFVNYFAGINFGYLAYGLKPNKLGNMAIAMHYINYGEFIRANELGIKEGTFRAAEYAFNVQWSRQLDSAWYVGAAFKPILSQLEEYVSFGAAIDAGIVYHKPKHLFSAALVIKNLGTQIKPYSKGNYEPLPFDIQLGVTKKLAHAPFRFSLLAHHLYTWDMTYPAPFKNKNLFGEVTEKETFGEKIGNNIENAMRHLNLGAELILSDNFQINLGYNHKRRVEMTIPDQLGFYGFSWGVDMKIKKYYISYGRAAYHFAGASNHFSININLDQFKKL